MVLKMQDMQIFYKEMEKSYYTRGYRKNYIRRNSDEKK